MVREQFFQTGAFEPEMVRRLCDTYDLVLEALRKVGETQIDPEVVALHIVTFARQGTADTTRLFLQTLRALNGESAVNCNSRLTDIEFLRWVRAGTRQTAQNIAQSLALVDAGNALIARIERQLSKSTL